jgi:hypothetical protein|tara:strand:+ start:2302 stop:2772 length:471 start_codon:yes stop_codon:yes gene_type:complete
MGTRSAIAMKTEDGIRSIYCHWDGYVDHNGRILKEFYSTDEKVKALLDLGDLSSLRQEIGEAHDFDRHYAEPNLEGMFDNWCLAYGRDRGETDVEAKTFDDVKTWVESMANSWCEYFYLWDGRDWIVSNGTMDPQGYPEFDFLEVAILKSIAGQEA